MEDNKKVTDKASLKENLRDLKRIVKVMHGIDKYYFPTNFSLHLVVVVTRYIGLFLSAYIIDALSAGETFGVIFRNVLISVLVIFLLDRFTNFVNQRNSVNSQMLADRFYCMTEQKMLEMDFSKVAGFECRDLLKRIRNDNNWGNGIWGVFQTINGLTYSFLNLIGAVFVGAPLVKMLFVAGSPAAWGVVAAAALVSILSTRLHNKYDKKKNHLIHNYWSEIPAEEWVSAPSLGWDFTENGMQTRSGKDIRIYGSDRLMKKYVLDNENAPYPVRWVKAVGKCSGATSLCYVVSGYIIEGTSYLLMAVLAAGGLVSLGDVVKYAGCIRNLFGELDKVIKRLPSLFLAVRKNMGILDLAALEDDMYKGKLPVEKRSDGQYSIEFKNVSFKYPGTEQYALKDFSLKLNIGEKLAIVGMNGSGKTTMIKLLCRLYDPDEGEILLNGVDIKKFRQDQYSELFSVVFQDFQLFDFEIGENVAASRDYDRERAWNCLESAGFGERLKSLGTAAMLENQGSLGIENAGKRQEALEDGRQALDIYIRKGYGDGVEVSGGEAQKIAIARAIYKDAPFILLDEPTAALDPISEYEIYSGFGKIIGDKTAIYISHRLSSCKFCERIAVFHEGRLIQTGSHSELLRDTGGKYYEMWEAQAQYYRENGQETLLAI